MLFSSLKTIASYETRYGFLENVRSLLPKVIPLVGCLLLSLPLEICLISIFITHLFGKKIQKQFQSAYTQPSIQAYIQNAALPSLLSLFFMCFALYNLPILAPFAFLLAFSTQPTLYFRDLKILLSLLLILFSSGALPLPALWSNPLMLLKITLASLTNFLAYSLELIYIYQNIPLLQAISHQDPRHYAHANSTMDWLNQLHNQLSPLIQITDGDFDNLLACIQTFESERVISSAHAKKLSQYLKLNFTQTPLPHTTWSTQKALTTTWILCQAHDLNNQAPLSTDMLDAFFKASKQRNWSDWKDKWVSSGILKKGTSKIKSLIDELLTISKILPPSTKTRYTDLKEECISGRLCILQLCFPECHNLLQEKLSISIPKPKTTDFEIIPPSHINNLIQNSTIKILTALEHSIRHPQHGTSLTRSNLMEHIRASYRTCGFTSPECTWNKSDDQCISSFFHQNSILSLFILIAHRHTEKMLDYHRYSETRPEHAKALLEAAVELTQAHFKNHRFPQVHRPDYQPIFSTTLHLQQKSGSGTSVPPLLNTHPAKQDRQTHAFPLAK